MKKLFCIVVSIVLFAVVSCESSIKNTQQARFDSLKKDSVMNANDTTKKVEENYIFIHSKNIHFENNLDGYHKAELILKAFNKARKWGKLNETIKIDIKKNLLNLTNVDSFYESLSNGSPTIVYINVNFIFQGNSDGTWGIKISPDKIIMDGYCTNSSPNDIEFLNEKTINDYIPELNEFIMSGKKQSTKEKLFN